MVKDKFISIIVSNLKLNKSNYKISSNIMYDNLQPILSKTIIEDKLQLCIEFVKFYIRKLSL